MSTPAILSTLGEDTARARRGDPTTSHEAADSISRKAREESAREVLAILADAEHPLTAEEIQEHHEARAFIGQAERTYSPSRIRTGLRQLRDDEQVEPTEQRGVTKTGRSAQTFTITQRGTDALHERNAT